MTSLETFALEWLRYARKCVLLVEQRSVTWHTGTPDCLGLDRHRRLVEIECKRTLSDFKADAKKRHVVYRGRGLDHFVENAAYQFYFIVPFALVARVTPLLPAWAGLLAAPNAFQEQEARVVVRAPLNKRSKRMSLLDCVRAASLQTNMVLAQRRKIDELKGRIEAMERGEFVCLKCGLRKDAEKPENVPTF